MKTLDDLAVGEEPEIGTVYLVPCVDISAIDMTQYLGYSYGSGHSIPFGFAVHQPCLTALPVLGHVHADPEFPGAGGESPHLHIDTRFVTPWELEHVWRNSQYNANDAYDAVLPIIPIEPGKRLPPTFLHPKECLLRHADFRRRGPIGGGTSYKKFEDAMARCTIDPVNPVCAHHGTPLRNVVVRDGTIVCPLHNATWCAATGKFVRRMRQDNGYLSMSKSLTQIRCGGEA